jgi:branched-chain amino acid transport system substrate-binding protein
VDIEHQQRDRDREHAVADRGDPADVPRGYSVVCVAHFFRFPSPGFLLSLLARLSAASHIDRARWGAKTRRNPQKAGKGRKLLRERVDMRKFLLLATAATAWLAALASLPARAASDKVVIGDIDDMSGVYADVIGPKAVEAIRFAIEDFGGSVLGKPIGVKTFDHQNKPDVGAQAFRRFADQDGVTMVLGGSNTGVSLAMSAVAKEKKVPFIAIGAAGASLTGKDCTPYTIHYAYDTTALGNGTATAILKEGGKSWFFLTADYAFGTQLQQSAERVIKANGGSVLGAVRVPLATSDFSSFLLQAQSSGAQVVGLANAGGDFINSLKAANEFGLTAKMKPAALLAFISDIHALGLETAKGLYLTAAWYWDLNDKSRAFAKRFVEKTGVEPTFNQAAFYSATLTYLNAVKAAGTTDSDKVMAELHKAKIDDMFTNDGFIRPDGLMQHSMYVFQVKTPAESKGPWDYYKVVQKMSGEQAFGSLADSTCPLVKK